MDPKSAPSAIESWPLEWWQGAMIVLVAAAIVAVFIRRSEAGRFGRALALVAAVAVGAVLGRSLWGDPWFGGAAGFVGSCSPWVVALVKTLAGKIVERFTK